jgi:hypothetical protein
MQGVGEPGTIDGVSTLPLPIVHLSNTLPEVVVVTDVKRTDEVLPPKPGMFVEPPEMTVIDWFVAVGDPLQVVDVLSHRS